MSINVGAYKVHLDVYQPGIQSSRDCKKFDLRSFRLRFSAREIRIIDTIFS